MHISIVIPTWRGRYLLEEYLPSVIAAADFYGSTHQAETEIIIVEDAGGDDTPSWLRSKFGERVRVLEHAQNQGFCIACQTGFKNAVFPLVLLLNNDVRLKEDCIGPMVGHFSDPDVFAVTGKMFSQKGNIFCNGGKVGQFRRGMWSSYLNYDVLPSAQAGISYLSFAAIGAFSVYDREKFLKMGGFDPITAMYEDIDISYKAWKRGWLIKYEPRSVAYHDASQTMQKRYRGRSRDRLSRRSRMLMHWILLHDRGMFLTHLASMTGQFLTSWLWMDWPFYWAFFTGLQHLPYICRKRSENRRNSVRSDRDLLKLLKHFYRTAPIMMR
ncbi:MAG: glycosyltransferase [Acidobacteria bacterium]|nr:glycosyltransferase [Acidobacteriota bacterium]